MRITKKDQIDMTRVFAYMAMALVEEIGDMINKKLPTSHSNKNGCYPFIPYDLMEAYELIKTVYDKLNNPRAKFLDCGCGIGNIVMLAYAIGFDAYGIEFSRKIFNMATKLSVHVDSLYGWNIIQDNILTYKNYSEYDVIYFFCPMCDYKKQLAFERRLMYEAKVGAYIITVGSNQGRFNESPCFEPITKNSTMPIFKKVKKGQ